MRSSLRKLFVRGLTSPRDVARHAGIPYLGAIPNMEAAGSGADSPAALVVDDPGSGFARAVRDVHAALVAGSPGARVVALTSAAPRDGKTTCSVALARHSAISGHRTLLVDCDLRRRSSTAVFDGAPPIGLLEVIEGACTLDEAITVDGLTKLSVLPVARNLDAIERATVRDVFGGVEMAQLFGRLRQRFDFILVDTPPVVIADTRRLAGLVDSYLFLTRWGRTPRHAIALALNILRSTGVPLAGLVLTRAPPEAMQAMRDGSAAS